MLQWSTPAIGVIAIGTPAWSDDLRGGAAHGTCVMDTLIRLGHGPVHRSDMGSASADGTDVIPGKALGGWQHDNRLLTTGLRAVVVADVPRLIEELESETEALLGQVSESRNMDDWEV